MKRVFLEWKDGHVNQSTDLPTYTNLPSIAPVDIPNTPTVRFFHSAIASMTRICILSIAPYRYAAR